MKPRVFRKLFLLATLTACGVPGSDAVFTKGNPKLDGGATDTAPQVAPRTTIASRLKTKRYGGYYRRVGDDSRFQPCGTRVPLVVTGTGDARFMLHERFRFTSVQQGGKMYGVLQGLILIDTVVSSTKPDSGKATERTRFFLTAVDSLRTWQNSDCGGMRVS